MTTFETAQQFYLLGTATFPVKPHEKKPAVDRWQPYQSRLPEPSEILSWWGGTSKNNLGVVGGWRGLTVVDFDSQTGYRRWKRWATAQGGLTRRIARLGYQVATSRGVHVYVWLNQPARNQHMPGIDIKTKGGYVLGEGSIHPDGTVYTNITPGMVILRAETLSQLLPPTLLVAQPDLPPMVNVPPILSQQTLVDDPWETAVRPQPSLGVDLVDTLKKRFNVGDFFPTAQATGGQGRWRVTQCPFHDDSDPSFWLDTERNLCGCFAGCTAKPLDVIDLYAWLYGLSNREAILTMAKS